MGAKSVFCGEAEVSGGASVSLFHRLQSIARELPPQTRPSVLMVGSAGVAERNSVSCGGTKREGRRDGALVSSRDSRQYLLRLPLWA